MFEVQDLKYATLATVSRCGMIWFSEETLTNKMILENYLAKLRREPLDETEREIAKTGQNIESLAGLILQRQIADILSPYFVSEERDDTLVVQVMNLAASKWHIMVTTNFLFENSKKIPFIFLI